MRLPPRFTPNDLCAELARAGQKITPRTLRLWRTQGLLPPLKARGRKGYRRGKEQFWQSPNLVVHAVTICRLRELRYPNDEARLVLSWMGFPVLPLKLRAAWLSRLDKMKASFKSRKAHAERRQESEFSTLEDEISELATPFARRIAKQLGLDRIEITQPIVDLFGLTFGTGYAVDVEGLEQILEFTKLILPISTEGNSWTEDNNVFATVKFIQVHMSFEAVEGIAKSATELELAYAHRYWRTILKLFQHPCRELGADDQLSKFLAFGFGRLCFPTIIRFIRDGKAPQIEKSITEISQLIVRPTLTGIISELSRGDKIDRVDKDALRELAATLKALAGIWDHQGFPFA